ncbi:AbrB/MazE/SpoVT family DNA-binding domain-containing protein [Halobacillus sp. HZG1]|uniref:AbrB/MazE/SpoVT family DNA-binding domain-containing protein n=1 Tax=Halobacillus sp. HZG1 TaxID=3111769 RepID=UPI002DBC2C82|nr:AbrB/MazE/SpoVT family DNA-binding domain-containing protein [Halobacillus sp. HZG1]MEC3884608.1 AbrB/MazE/SpoVT family DNA-binding domain-containing protein [Halobacillus sp. HZG1]
MKALGIVRKLDELGRVVVPKEVRDSQGWRHGQPLEMFMNDDSLVIRPYGKEEEKQIVLEELNQIKNELSKESQETIQKVIDYVEK